MNDIYIYMIRDFYLCMYLFVVLCYQTMCVEGAVYSLVCPQRPPDGDVIGPRHIDIFKGYHGRVIDEMLSELE